MSERTVVIPLPGVADFSGAIEIGNRLPLVLIMGPCVVENEDHAVWMAKELNRVALAAGVRWVYKSSYDKANRTSGWSERGPGLEEGLRVLGEVRARVGCPVLTDVHAVDQCAAAAAVADILQVPAFLCRQTDLIREAARVGRPVNLKRGQFAAPGQMEHAAAKVEAVKGAESRILLTERGTSFGHGDLVVDFRSMPIMAATGWPVIFDATHSVQTPGGSGGTTGGRREFIAPLARAAVATGVAGVFLEVHEEPARAPCDGSNMLPLDQLPDLLEELVAIDRIRKERLGA